MSTFKAIREQLALTQAEMAALLDVSQGSVSFYENGKTIPPLLAKKLIDAAKQRGISICFDDLYGSLTVEKV